MDYPKSVLLLTPRTDQYILALDTLSARGVDVRCMEGPFRLAVDFAANPAEIVILDIEWFAQPVTELIEILRESSPTVGVVIIAAPEQRDIAGAALSRGADILLTKPASCAEIIESVERAGRRLLLAQAGRTNTELTPELLTKFAMGVAHEINNPLTTISGWLQLLISDHADKPELTDMLKSVSEEADRIAEVVRQLLTVAQQRPPRQDKLNLRKIIEELARARKVSSPNIDISMSIAAKLPDICGDDSQLRKACDTILDESLSSLNGNGRVRISCKPKNRGIQISIKDNGDAMSDEARAALFEPFEFGRNPNGAGLGLCLSHAIIRSHGGTMDLDSTDSGTRFNVWLPASNLEQE
jgi:signal transduction histidine kinase